MGVVYRYRLIDGVEVSLRSSLDRVPLERAVQVSVVAPCPTTDERHHAGDGLRGAHGVFGVFSVSGVSSVCVCV